MTTIALSLLFGFSAFAAFTVLAMSLAEGVRQFRAIMLELAGMNSVTKPVVNRIIGTRHAAHQRSRTAASRSPQLPHLLFAA